MLTLLPSYPRKRKLVLNLLVALVYFFMARASLAVAFEYSNATPVWPCSGFALAVVLLWGYDVVPAIALGAFAANVATFLLNKTAGPGTAIWVSALISIGNAGEALAGYFLLNKFMNIHNIFFKARSVFKFSFVALIMCIVSCTIGTTAVLLGGMISLSHYMEVWLTWWAGDVSGVLIVTPLILVFASSKSLYAEPRDTKTTIEVLVFFLLLILLSGILFEDWFNPMFIFTRAFLLVPLLIWASLRFDQREVIFAVIVSSGFAVFGTMDHHGAFVTDSLNESLVTAEVYCSINAVLALVLNALIMERKRSETILKQARDELELRVQKRTEELTRSNQQLSEAQRLAHIGSWEWDIANNKITWSDELFSIYGLSKNQFDPAYENFLERLHPDDRAYANETIQRAYKNHQPFYFYHRIIRPGGEVRLLLGQGEVITDDKGEPIKMTGTGLDVTEIKKAEDLLKKTTIELEKKNEELERSNKELASFSYIASHDLQEPLRKMQTFSERILQNESEKLSDSGKDYFRRIQSAAGRMQQLIEDLLSYSRVNTAEKLFVETDVNMLLQEVKNDLSDFIQTSNATIDAGTLPPFKLIPFQFRQLLTNIISNSIKFSKPGCAPYISIKAGFEKGSEIDEPDADREKIYYHLSVADNGIGFEQKFSKKIFDIFQRLHGRHEYPGTGIGLAICKKIVENHYGFITAKSQIDEGATFNIYLPVLSEEEMKKMLHSNLQ